MAIANLVRTERPGRALRLRPTEPSPKRSTQPQYRHRRRGHELLATAPGGPAVSDRVATGRPWGEWAASAAAGSMNLTGIRRSGTCRLRPMVRRAPVASGPFDLGRPPLGPRLERSKPLSESGLDCGERRIEAFDASRPIHLTPTGTLTVALVEVQPVVRDTPFATGADGHGSGRRVRVPATLLLAAR